MSRHTEPAKWEDPWFSGLSKDAGWLFLYLCDAADNAGFVEVNHRVIGFHTQLADVQAPLDELMVPKATGKRSVVAAGGWLWLVNFAKIQKCWPLNRRNRQHSQIISLMEYQAERFSGVPEFAEKMATIPADEGMEEADMMTRDELRNRPKDWAKIRRSCMANITTTLNDLTPVLMEWWDHRLEMGSPLEYGSWRKLNDEMVSHHPEDIRNAINYAISQGMVTLNFTMAKKLRLDAGSAAPPPARTEVRPEPKTDWKTILLNLYPDARVPRSFWNLAPSTQIQLRKNSPKLNKELS